MNKLLNTFIAKPTLKNAAKIKAYLHKHPMSVCLLPSDVMDIVNEIINQA